MTSSLTYSRSMLLTALLVALVVGSGVPAKAATVVSYGTSTISFATLSGGVPNITNSDYAAAASGNGVTADDPVGTLQTGFNNTLQLFDGGGGFNSGSGVGSILFPDSTIAGDAIILVDLQSVVSVTGINTYSAHDGIRTHQRYQVYGSKTLNPPSPATDTGWTLIADVTPSADQSFNGFVGVSISETTGSLGNFRYLRFDTLDPFTLDPFTAHTLYQEIDVFASPVPEPGSLVLAALGLIGLGWFGWRRR